MDAQKEWPSILKFGTGDTVTVRLVEQRYRQLAKKYHPDAGGSDEDMQQLNLAKQLALKWIENERNRQEQAKRLIVHVAAAQEQMHQFNQSYAYQQQQMAGWASAMGGYASSAGASQSAKAAQDAYDFQVKQHERQKDQAPPSWWQRHFGK